LTRITNSAILIVRLQQCNVKGAPRVNDDDLLHTKQVSQEYGINAGTLRYWRSTNQGPASFTLGPRGRVVYRRSECERWITEQEKATRRGGGDAA
jgi:predicted DNA-binding transcriptional regulator AlpA